VKLQFKSTDNPFSNKNLDSRQQARKRQVKRTAEHTKNKKNSHFKDRKR